MTISRIVLVHYAKTALWMFGSWFPLALLRLGLLCLLAWISPALGLASVAFILLPGLLLLCYYPFYKDFTWSPTFEAGNLLDRFGALERETDLKRFRRYNIAGTVTTMAGAVAALLVSLALFSHFGIDDLDIRFASRDLRAEWHESLMASAPSQLAIGYLIGWLATPLLMRALFGCFESPFVSFRNPTPIDGLVAHAGNIKAGTRLRGRGKTNSTSESRWLPKEEE